MGLETWLRLACCVQTCQGRNDGPERQPRPAFTDVEVWGIALAVAVLAVGGGAAATARIHKPRHKRRPGATGRILRVSSACSAGV